MKGAKIRKGGPYQLGYFIKGYIASDEKYKDLQ